MFPLMILLYIIVLYVVNWYYLNLLEYCQNKGVPPSEPPGKHAPCLSVSPGIPS